MRMVCSNIDTDLYVVVPHSPARARSVCPIGDQQGEHRFRSTDGWSAGGDASVAVLQIGANGTLDTSTSTGQVNAFVLTNQGLMAGASLEGTKVTRLALL